MSVSETLAWYPSASPILVFDPFLSLRFLAKVAAFLQGSLSRLFKHSQRTTLKDATVALDKLGVFHPPTCCS